MEENPASSAADRLVALLSANLGLLLGVQLLTLVAFGTYAFLATPLYRASAVVAEVSTSSSGLGQFQAIASQLGSLGALAGLNVGSGSSSDRHPVATIKSHQFLAGFIQEHQLMPSLFPDVDFNEPPGTDTEIGRAHV